MKRIFSTRSERDSVLATLWFNIAHYALRPWPWVLVGLASLVLYPGLEDPETGYVLVMINYLPSYLRGLMVAGFAAADVVHQLAYLQAFNLGRKARPHF